MRGARASFAAALVLAGLTAWTRPAAAQRAIVVPQPQGTAVGVAVTLSAGGIWDAESEAGATRLAAEAAVERVRPELAALGGSARVDCERSYLRVTLLAPSTTWREAAKRLLDAIFHPDIPDEALERARARLSRALALEAGNPAEEIRVAAHEALFGPGHRWARPRCGTSETIDSIAPEAVARAARLRFDSTRATAAVVGPVDAVEARTLLSTALGPSMLPVLLPSPEFAGPASRNVDAGTVTSWVAVAYPLPAMVDEEAARLLGEEVVEALRPGFERPDMLDASAAVERWGGGGALIVYAITDPERARTWASRIQEMIEGVATKGVAADPFRALLRRYRGLRLRELATPEERAAEASLRLFVDHAYEPVEARIDALTAARLQLAAGRLGAPAVAILGPEAAPSSLDRAK